VRLAERISRIEPSITLSLDARAKGLIAAGEDVVNMTVGEPDFAAPAVVQETAVELVRSGAVRYTQTAGTPGLRGAIAEHLGRTRGGAWSPEEVTVCHSAKHALAATLMVLVEDGDEVLVPLPAWASYFDQIRITGAEPVLVPSPADEAGFHPDLEALARATSPRTRALMINSPNNPSGTVWTPEEVEGIARLAVEKDLWLISDEIYRALVYEGPEATSPASVSEEARARTIVVDGASKCFAMTGYRIGFLAGPREITAAVAKLGSQTNGSPNAIGQAGYEQALRSDPPELDAMRAAFAERRTVLLAGLAELGLPTPRPRGAFYAFPDVSAHVDQRGSVGFCEDLLEEQRLALVPGAAFGSDDHVRLSYATDLDSIREALRRLGAFLRRSG
jgi:aspartate aminotransferase